MALPDLPSSFYFREVELINVFGKDWDPGRDVDRHRVRIEAASAKKGLASGLRLVLFGFLENGVVL